MKLLLLSCIFTVIIANAFGKIAAKYQKFPEECKKELGISVETQTKITNREYTDPEVEKYLKCLFTKSSLLDKDGKIIKTRIEEVMMDGHVSPPYLLKCFKQDTVTPGQFMKCFMDTADEMSSKFSDSIAECKIQLKNDDVKFPDISDEPSKEHLLCVFRKTGMIDASDKFEVEMVKEFMNNGDPLPDSVKKCMVNKSTPMEIYIDIKK